MELVSPSEYVAQAAALIDKAKKRVYLIAMVFADHPNTHELVMAIENAASRGVKVVVAADIFTFGEVGGSFLPLRYTSLGAKDTRRMVRALKKAGVDFHWLGRGRLTLFNGRTHSKWCVVDDTVFCFGGVNIHQGSIENIDYMLRTKNPKLADRLCSEQERIQKAEKQLVNYPSIEYQHDELIVLVDGGIIGQSAIYRRVCELAKQAAQIVFVSQYCPTGKIARLLRKRPSTLYFNRLEQAHGLNLFVNRLGQFFSGLQNSYLRQPYLHAKCIIFTLPDGTKTAITGSHNFAYTGVLAGTREIALETSDPNIIRQLESFITNEVARAGN